MAHTNPWLNTTPAGSIDANKLDDSIRQLRLDLQERLSELFGGLTLPEFQADPVIAKGLNNDITIDHATGDVGVRRDISAVGGFHQTLTGWSVTNVAASVAATEVPGPLANRIQMALPGSILGIVVALAGGQARTAGTLTVEVWKGAINAVTGVRTDTATGLTAVINDVNPAFKVTTQAKDADAFAAGDELFLKYVTDAGWLPTTADFTASVLVEC